VLKALLFFQLMFVVNQIHFPWGTGIPGVVPTNIIFVLILLSMRGKPDVLTLREPPILHKALLTFIIAMFVAFVWAEVTAFGDLVADFTYVKNAAFYPLYYWLYLHCKQDEKTTRWMIIFVLVIAAVAGVEAIREGIDYGFGKYNPFRRASGPFGEDWHNSNRAGVFYGMFVAMFMALALFLKGRKLWRLAAVGGVVLLVGGALFTYSRQSYILILFALAVLLLRKSIVLAVVLGAIIASSISFLPDAVTQRVEETEQQGAHGEEQVDVSTQSRWEIWEGAMGMLKEHPLGVGLFRFRNNIGNYSKYKHMDAHNFYVLTIAEMGPQGEICLILLLVAMMRLSSFLRKSVPPNDPERRALALGFTVMSINVMLGNIYGSPFLEGAVMAPYWAMAGLLERYMQFPSQAGAAEEPNAPREATLVERFPLATHLGPPRA
jgi:O-antigen ligase